MFTRKKILNRVYVKGKHFLPFCTAYLQLNLKEVRMKTNTGLNIKL